MDYDKFDSVRRCNDDINDYISNFESAYGKLKKHKLDLPNVVLGCKLLKNAELEIEKRQLVLTATKDLQFDSVKSALKRIYASAKTIGSSSNEALKDETAFSTDTTESALASFSKGKSYRGMYKSRGVSNLKRPNGSNPLDHSGRVSTCRVCGSRYHWQRNCPEKVNDFRSNQRTNLNSEKSDVNEEGAFLTFATDSEMTFECVNKVILDTACTKTVAGLDWIQRYMSTLTGEQAKQVSEKPSFVSIGFGDGRRIKCIKTILLPISIGSMNCKLRVEVIPGTLPLLFSVKSLKSAGITINTRNMTISTVVDEKIPICELSSGHIALEIKPNEDQCNS